MCNDETSSGSETNSTASGGEKRASSDDDSGLFDMEGEDGAAEPPLQLGEALSAEKLSKQQKGRLAELSDAYGAVVVPAAVLALACKNLGVAVDDAQSYINKRRSALRNTLLAKSGGAGGQPRSVEGVCKCTKCGTLRFVSGDTLRSKRPFTCDLVTDAAYNACDKAQEAAAEVMHSQIATLLERRRAALAATAAPQKAKATKKKQPPKIVLPMLEVTRKYIKAEDARLLDVASAREEDEGEAVGANGDQEDDPNTAVRTKSVGDGHHRLLKQRVHSLAPKLFSYTRSSRHVRKHSCTNCINTTREPKKKKKKKKKKKDGNSGKMVTPNSSFGQVLSPISGAAV